MNKKGILLIAAVALLCLCYPIFLLPLIPYALLFALYGIMGLFTKNKDARINNVIIGFIIVLVVLHFL